MVPQKLLSRILDAGLSRLWKRATIELRVETRF